MMSAIADPDRDPDVAEYFETRTVTADPLLNRTAGRLTDAEERSLGTDPSESDTTGDGISDARALELDEEDPTVFKTSGPRVDVVKFAGGWDDGSVELPDDGGTLPEVDRPGYTYEYHFITDDPTRVSRVTLTHSGRTRLDETYSGKRTVRESGEYHAEAEAALSHFRGANTQVTTEDEHGNERVVSVYSKRSFAGTAASNLPMQQEEMGQLSGFTYGAAELPDFVRIILTEPKKVGRNLAELYAEYIEAKQGGVRSENEFWIKMAKGMAESTYQDQDDDNPHALPAEAENPREALDICVDQYVDQSQSDYCKFATGWYKGYSMFMILETVVGSKGISKASKFDDIKPDLEAGLRQIDDSHRLVRGEVPDTKTGKISQRLMADGGTPDIDAPAVRQGLNDRGITTAGGQKRALDRLERIDHLDALSSSEQAALAARLIKVADPDATVRFVNQLDDTSDVRYLLDEDAATMNRLVRWHANPEAHDLIDPKLSATDFVHVARNGDVDEIHLAVRRSDDFQTRGKAQWLETGDSARGLEHIDQRHATSDQFYAIEGVDSLEDVKRAIFDTVKQGETNKIPESDGGGTAYVHQYTPDKKVTVIIADNGYVVTARPGDYS